LNTPEWAADDPLRYASMKLYEWFCKEMEWCGEVDLHVQNGDGVEGFGRKDTVNHMTTNTREQAEIAAKLLSKVKAKQRYIVRGTPYHTDTTENHEDIIADKLGCPIDEELRLDIHGCRFHFRHVSPRGNTPYTQPTQTYKEAVRELLNAIDDQYDAADVVVRSHIHTYWKIERFGRTPDIPRVAFTTPCLKLPGSVFGRKLMTFYYDVGYVYVEIEDSGEPIVRPRRFPLQLVTPKRYIVV
jgi:hypothetical protein